MIVATSAVALRAPSYDYDSPKPGAAAPRDYEAPRPALRSPQYDHDSPRPFRATPAGYQFSSFRGPVSGNIEEIEVPYVLPQGAGVNPYGDSRNPAPSKAVDYVVSMTFVVFIGATLIRGHYLQVSNLFIAIIAASRMRTSEGSLMLLST